MSTPLRSVMIGDIDHYFSPYIFGVNQGMTALGHFHMSVSNRWPASVIARKVADIQPDIIWGHMLHWPPREGLTSREVLIEIVRQWFKRGTKVIIHDGDNKERVPYPHDLSDHVSLALCNHKHDRSPWRVGCINWPYFAFNQDKIAEPASRWGCDLFFAGSLGNPGDSVYGRRSALVQTVQRAGIDFKVFQEFNTLLHTPRIAASATAVLGFGRPEDNGWTDTRVFQYPGAGAVLLHDHVNGWLEPDQHYIPYKTGDADSVMKAVNRVKKMPEAENRALRKRAFDYVQTEHSSIARVHSALMTVGLA
jgi:hypothetical protein